MPDRFCPKTIFQIFPFPLFKQNPTYSTHRVSIRISIQVLVMSCPLKLHSASPLPRAHIEKKTVVSIRISSPRSSLEPFPNQPYPSWKTRKNRSRRCKRSSKGSRSQVESESSGENTCGVDTAVPDSNKKPRMQAEMTK